MDVGDLLGAAAVSEKDNGEIAQQLARINEQLAIKNRRARRVWKTIGIVAAVVASLNILMMVLGYAAFGLLQYEEEPLEEVAIVEAQTPEN